MIQFVGRWRRADFAIARMQLAGKRNRRVMSMDKKVRLVKNILLVEDDESVANVICFYLQQNPEYRVAWARNAEEALTLVREPTDLILLDICLPDVNGVSLCATLRQSIYCPIIFISCLDDEDTIVRALGTGGDDYLTKPFSGKILQSRIEANLRRVRMEHMEQARAGQARYDFPDFSLDCATHSLTRAGQIHHLAPIEYAILLYFIQNPERIISLDELYEKIWETPVYGDLRTVITHVYNLRKIVEPDPGRQKYICNIRGSGYCFRGGKL